MSPARYRVNQPAVVHQAFDGEVILVNLERGHYYSLETAGAAAFDALAAGLTLPEVAARFTSSHGEPGERVVTELVGFVRQLVEEGLLVPRLEPPGEPPQVPAAPAAFGALTLSKYTDMQDLLLLDPIHEVDDAGWPLLKK